MKSEDNIEIEPIIDEKFNENKSMELISSSEVNLDDNKQENEDIEDKENRNSEEEKGEKEEKEESNLEININDSLKLYENRMYNNDNNDLLGSEEIFINQKIEIEKMKKKNELFYSKKESKSNSLANTKNNFNNNNYQSINKSNEVINTNIELNDNQINNLVGINNEIIDVVQTFSLTECKNFEYFIINDENENEKSKILEIDDNNMWKPLNDDFPFSYGEDTLRNSYNFIEINNMAIRFMQQIDYEEKGLELNINFNLEEQSELWIFTRCYVNKSINESYYFDEKSENIDINDNFNKYTSLIKIIKDEKFKRCYITFGTFYNDVNENNNLYYKYFLKRQLVDYSNDNLITNNIKEDKSKFNVIITDLGEETINVKIFLNNKEKYNEINGNFFLPINKKAKMLICGKGKSVELKNLVVKLFNRRKMGLNASTQFETENDSLKNCECCSIL